jgi:phage terminase Nu1 subunit (DNA packaging protein)
MPQDAKPLSVHAFAKRVGVAHKTIQLAIASGRITSVVMVNGAPKIADGDAAEREWIENTRPKSKPAADEDGAGSYGQFRKLREEELWKQAQLKRETDELELAVRKGLFVPVAEAEAKLAEEYAAVRTRLLALPARLKQYLTHLSVSDVRLVETLVREALEELSG